MAWASADSAETPNRAPAKTRPSSCAAAGTVMSTIAHVSANHRAQLCADHDFDDGDPGTLRHGTRPRTSPRLYMLRRGYPHRPGLTTCSARHSQPCAPRAEHVLVTVSAVPAAVADRGRSDPLRPACRFRSSLPTIVRPDIPV